MSILRRTATPEPPTVEELLCAFANGSCICAETRRPPCLTVKIAADRIRNRVEHDLAVARCGKAVAT